MKKDSNQANEMSKADQGEERKRVRWAKKLEEVRTIDEEGMESLSTISRNQDKKDSRPPIKMSETSSFYSTFLDFFSRYSSGTFKEYKNDIEHLLLQALQIGKATNEMDPDKTRKEHLLTAFKEFYKKLQNTDKTEYQKIPNIINSTLEPQQALKKILEAPLNRTVNISSPQEYTIEQLLKYLNEKMQSKSPSPSPSKPYGMGIKDMGDQKSCNNNSR